MNALVLSGGGANGSFQLGAICKLLDDGYTFDGVSGVSVGALNGSMVATDRIDQLLSLWFTIRGNHDIYKKYSIASLSWRLLIERQLGLHGAAPLLEKIRKYVTRSNVSMPFYFGVTDYSNESYLSLSPKDFDSDEQYQNAIFASALMPIVWNPASFHTRSRVVTQGYDGGVRNVTPIGDVIDLMPDRIIVISCNNPKIPKLRHVKNIIESTKRTIEIMVSEIVHTDITELLRINRLVLQARDRGYELVNEDGRTYKYFETLIIEPQEVLGDPLDFRPDEIKRRFDIGIGAVK